METSVICKYMWICVHVTPLKSAVHFGLMYLFCLLWPALCTHRLLSVPAARALLSTSIHHHYTCPDAGPLLNHSLPYLDLQDRPGQGRAGKQQTSIATLHFHCLPVPKVWGLDGIWKGVDWNWSCYIIYTTLCKWHQALNPTLIHPPCETCRSINSSIDYNRSGLVLTPNKSSKCSSSRLFMVAKQHH